MGNPSDYVHTAYLGLALLILAVLASRRRADGRSAALWAVLAAGVVLAMGPVLVWDGLPLGLGGREVSLPLPYLALEALPGFGSLSLLWRLATVSALALAVLADRCASGWVLLVIVEVFVVSSARDLPELTPVPETAALHALAAAPEGAVLNLPPTASRTYLYDQVVHGKPTVGSLNTGINLTGLQVTTAARYLRDGAIDVGGLTGAARDAGVRYAIVHRDQLMEDHYVEAAGALKRHATLLAEDERMRIYALY
jgi:signal transduction histidine kinase